MTAILEDPVATMTETPLITTTLNIDGPKASETTNVVVAICRHCQSKKATRPRGLCWGCYFTPGIKNLHPSMSKYGRRGVGNMNRNRVDDDPTDAPPGSEAKLAILADRARRNVSLWHPQDARYPGDPRPEN